MRKIAVCIVIILIASYAVPATATVPHVMEPIRISSVPLPGKFCDLNQEAVYDAFKLSDPGWSGGPSLAASFTGGGSRFPNTLPTTNWVSQTSFNYDRSGGNITGTSTPVPEPLSLVLLGMGLVGGRLAARRRKTG